MVMGVDIDPRVYMGKSSRSRNFRIKSYEKRYRNWALSNAAFTTPCRSCGSTIVCVFSSSPALLPCYCSLAFRHQVRQLTSGVSSKPQSDNRRYKVSCRDAQRSRDGRQSPYRARCDWDPGVHRWQQLAPCEYPPDSIAGRKVTGKMLDYTAHMYSSKEKTSARGRQAKEYTPHPLWLVVPDQVSESPCTRRQRDPEAMLRSGGGVPGDTPRDTGAKIPFILPIRCLSSLLRW